ncbi:MAG: HypC/HybG/HupF family hydrogenase formation chaperone [Gammaproteobacteria bacterium]|nr:HypC/HybG/HupF family hydrogenase formation chaperone [Gammaproteobacteria bacterium]
MCIGAPVQVIESRDFTALCRDRHGEEAEVNMMLIGPQEAGAWIVNYLGSAREVLSEKDAKHIIASMDELEAMMSEEQAQEEPQIRASILQAAT